MTLNTVVRSIAAAILTSLAVAATAQTDPQTPPPQPLAATSTEPEPQPQTIVPPAPSAPAPAPQSEADRPPILSRAASGAYDRRDIFPSVNIYLPEGQASVRLRKLIRNVLFESQIDYRFVNGDISTFLRYKYYARSYTYKIGVFDAINFPGFGTSGDFERVRGGLLLVEVPHDYNNRYFGLVEDDRLTFGDITQVDNRKNDIYTKLGYQYGTEFDEHLNAIVGESRGRIVPVLTAFREIGPQHSALAAAITESAKVSTGAYQYTKVEAEGLHRFDITGTSFVVTRVHVGTFPTKQTVRDASFPNFQRFSIPDSELFRLGGREGLRSISGSSDEAAGTNELHMTNEYFLPVFRNRDYSTWALHWNTLYAIGYAGAGAVGFDAPSVLKPRNFAVDGGLGAESTIIIRDFEVLLSAVFAHTFRGPADLRGNKFIFSVRTIR